MHLHFLKYPNYKYNQHAQNKPPKPPKKLPKWFFKKSRKNINQDTNSGSCTQRYPVLNSVLRQDNVGSRHQAFVPSGNSLHYVPYIEGNSTEMSNLEATHFGGVGDNRDTCDSPTEDLTYFSQLEMAYSAAIAELYSRQYSFPPPAKGLIIRNPILMIYFQSWTQEQNIFRKNARIREKQYSFIYWCSS